MSTLTITTFVTLDGVMQAPGGPDEDRSGGFQHGSWTFPYFNEEAGRRIGEIFSRADAFLLGRKTYEIFAAYWPRMTDPADPIAGPLNRLPKYVASRSLQKADWQNSTVIRDVAKEVADLKRRHRREIQVHGSGGLAQALLEHGLIDEFRLWQFPVVLGTGKRLFGQGTVPSALELVETATMSTGVVFTAYRPAGKPKYGSFG